MKEAQERVRRFHEAMSGRGDIGDLSNPGLTEEASALRARLLMEECVEACLALLGGCTNELMDNYDRAVHAWIMKREQPSIAGIAQELADVCVIALGTAVAAGIDLAPVFDEVMSANERKVGPGARVREDGKLLKPDGWVGPDVEAVLQRQRKEYGQ